MTKGIGGQTTRGVMFGDIERIAADAMTYDSNIDGKNSFGSELSTMFGGFAVGENTRGLTKVPTKAERADLVGAEIMPSGAKNYLDFCISSTINNGRVISDENIPATLEERSSNIVVEFVDINKADEDSIRPASLKAPIWIEGNRILSSGTTVDNDDKQATRSAGPLNLVFNKKKGLWEQPQSFPCPARVFSVEGSNSYTVDILGSSGKDEVSDRELMVTSLINDDRQQIKDVFNLQEDDGELAVGDFVTLFYDARSDNYVCARGGGSGSVPKLAINGVVADFEGTSLTIPSNEIIVKIEYTTIQGIDYELSDFCLNFSTSCLKTGV